VFPVAGTLARAAKSIYVRREGRGLWWLLNPAQFAGVVFVMLAVDLATFVGWAQAVWWWRRNDDARRTARLNAPKPEAEHEPR